MAAAEGFRLPGMESGNDASPENDDSFSTRDAIKKLELLKRASESHPTATEGKGRRDGHTKRSHHHSHYPHGKTEIDELDHGSHASTMMGMVMFYCVPDNGSPFGEQFAGVYSTSVALPRESVDPTSGDDTETDTRAQAQHKRGFPKNIKRASPSGQVLISDQLVSLEAVGIRTRTGTGSNIYRYTRISERDFDHTTPRHDEQIWTRTDDAQVVVSEDHVQILRRHISDAVRYANGLGKRVIVYGRGRGASRLMAASMTLESDILDNILYFVLESPVTTITDDSSINGCMSSVFGALFSCGRANDKKDPIDWITGGGTGKHRFIILSATVDSESPTTPTHIQELRERLSSNGHIERNMCVPGARHCSVLRAGAADIIPRLHAIAMDVIQGESGK